MLDYTVANVYMDDIPGVCLLGIFNEEKSSSSKALKYLSLFITWKLDLCLLCVGVVDYNLAQEAHGYAERHNGQQNC